MAGQVCPTMYRQRDLLPWAAAIRGHRDDDAPLNPTLTAGDRVP
jgi:hypothetical protein